MTQPTITRTTEIIACPVCGVEPIEVWREEDTGVEHPGVRSDVTDEGRAHVVGCQRSLEELIAEAGEVLPEPE